MDDLDPGPSQDAFASRNTDGERPHHAVEKGRYSGTDSFFYDDCGFPVQVQVDSAESSVSEKGSTGTRPPSSSKTTSLTEKYTPTSDTGEFFVVRCNGIFNETKATRIEGSVFMFTSVVAGQPFTVEDSAGNVVLRDRGSIRETILFDTEGDNVPGGIFIESVDVQVNGPHPGFFVDFCEIAGSLIGS